LFQISAHFVARSDDTDQRDGVHDISIIPDWGLGARDLGLETTNPLDNDCNMRYRYCR
jgi:hypothetical protein